MIFQYGREPVLIQGMLIGFKAMLESGFHNIFCHTIKFILSYKKRLCHLAYFKRNGLWELKPKVSPPPQLFSVNKGFATARHYITNLGLYGDLGA